MCCKKLCLATGTGLLTKPRRGSLQCISATLFSQAEVTGLDLVFGTRPDRLIIELTLTIAQSVFRQDKRSSAVDTDIDGVLDATMFARQNPTGHLVLADM